MDINKLISKLTLRKVNAVRLDLQVLECKDGSKSLVYSTYKKSNTIKLFGTDRVITTSSIDTSVPKSTSGKWIHTAWVSDDISEFKAIADEFGEVAVGIITEGVLVPHTLQQAEQLLADDSTSVDVSDSASAPF
tara:strand:- start:1131 stop:1532 length:402 start_codon:yes stop_codon:yes gene_type:complete